VRRRRNLIEEGQVLAVSPFHSDGCVDSGDRFAFLLLLLLSSLMLLLPFLLLLYKNRFMNQKTVSESGKRTYILSL